MLKAKLLAGGGTATLYAEDVFSAYTYTGNGSTQTITNGIDLAGKGGMVWTKNRSNASSNSLVDTTRGVHKYIQTNSTAAEGTSSATVTAFSSTGFSIGSDGWYNASSQTYVSWTFRNADNFYNHTTVVKTGGSNATVSFANLTTLGMVRVKRTDSTGSWYIWHRSLTAGKLLIGETTAAEATLGHITVSGTTVTLVNGVIADGTYLVEGFAHDTSADGLIQCGSFTTDGSRYGSVNLGWEPQYVLYKNVTRASDWYVLDSSRGLGPTTVSGDQTGGGTSKQLFANTTAVEGAGQVAINATGFTQGALQVAGDTFVYLAIRRPNKPPTTGTQVYNAIARTGTGAAATVTGVGFAPDLYWIQRRNGAGYNQSFDRLRGALRALERKGTAAENGHNSTFLGMTMDGVSLGTDASAWNVNTSAETYINHFFKRAPGVFDVVCYTGTGSATTVAHGLGAVPELMIVKIRSPNAYNWYVYHPLLGNDKHAELNLTRVPQTSTSVWNNLAPTASAINLGTNAGVNEASSTYVAYLFATLAGISKCFSFTGNGTNQNIECGFTTGARFVLLKRTDSTGGWLVADTTRGLVAGNDPSLALNSTAAEVTTLDWIDPYTGGFNIVQEATNNANVNAATYIGIAFS